ncbi:MobV family relaxase, partial [Sulfitobacter pontiacus]
MTTDLHQANKDGGAQALWRSAKSKATDDRPFAILRYAKLKSIASIAGSAAHMRRTIDTPNADPSRTTSNTILVGSTKPADDVQALLPELGQRLDPNDSKSKLLRRSNSVLAVEVLMTTSPEWWRVATPAEQDDWIERSTAWLAEEWGVDNIAHLELHIDETTPHLTGFVVPLDAEGGLNARQYIGGKASKARPGSSLLSGHQTRYAASVEALGLRRGRLGSDATHETMRSYQRRAKGVLDELNVPEIGTPPLVGREAWAAQVQARVREAFEGVAVRAAEAATEHRKAKAAGKTADRAQASADEAKAARKELANRCRELDMKTVAEDLGLEYDAQDQRWKSGPQGARDHRIEITDQKWRCAVLQTGGHGAIDLVKAVQGTDFNGALAYLAGRYGLDAAAADTVGRRMDRATAQVQRAVDTRPALQLPEPSPDRWHQVRDHLVSVRGIDPEILDQAHDAGDVYAQERPGQHGPMVNAVFVCRDADGNPTGAEIKSIRPRPDGSYWGAVALGTNKRAGSFRAGLRDLAQAARVVVVESAIDALSALGWIRRVKGYDGAVSVVSTAGDGALPASLSSSIPKSTVRYAGQDRNKAGDRQARKMGDGWKRLTPPKPHVDWNDWAKAQVRVRQSSESTSPSSAPIDPNPEP